MTLRIKCKLRCVVADEDLVADAYLNLHMDVHCDGTRLFGSRWQCDLCRKNTSPVTFLGVSAASQMTCPSSSRASIVGPAPGLQQSQQKLAEASALPASRHTISLHVSTAILSLSAGCVHSTSSNTARDHVEGLPVRPAWTDFSDIPLQDLTGNT